MLRFHVESQWNPTEPTGIDLILLKSKIHAVERIAAGLEGTIYKIAIEDEKHQPWVMVLKKFDHAKEVMDTELTALEEKELEVRLCRTTSENAQTFREAGLPVLLYVKSFLSNKDIMSKRLHQVLPELQPPYVVMTKLLTAVGVDNELRSFISNKLGLAALLKNNPVICDQMVMDLARVHKLGFTMASFGKGRHPIYTLWNFTVDVDGQLERWMVDLSNVESKDKLPLHRREEIFAEYASEDLEDMLFVMEVISVDSNSENHFRTVYQREKNSTEK